MPLIQNVVGSSIYVWSKKTGAPSEKRLVITSHGDESNINGMAAAGVPRSCKLVFYGPHGYMLRDPNLPALIAGNLVIHETVDRPQSSQDYQLQKYTNTNDTSTRHNEVGETYASIAGMLELFPMIAGMAQKAGENVYAANYSKQFGMDILTVRSRRFHKDPKLSQVLQELWKSNYRYDEIHCAFCRGEAGINGTDKGFPAPSIPGKS